MDDALTRVGQHAAPDAASLRTREWVCARYDELGPGLRRYLARMLGDSAAAEDLVQETFLRLHEEVRKNRLVRRPRPWVYQVGHNLAIDLVRSRGIEEWAVRQARAEGPPDEKPGVEAAMLAGERHRQVRHGLCLLSPQERQVLELRAEGLRYREIAELMGLQMSTVTTFLSRAVRKIARQIHG